MRAFEPLALQRCVVERAAVSAAVGVGFNGRALVSRAAKQATQQAALGLLVAAAARNCAFATTVTVATRRRRRRCRCRRRRCRALTRELIEEDL